ncbi:MAG: tyrosine-protein phosphatase [Sphaerochaetaceae bacterium]|nr:tyrosine-protein phosphatase [Sphaerochaetaceae bacterium]
MRTVKKILAIVFILAVVLSSVVAQSIIEKNFYQAEVPSLEAETFTTKYGHLITTGTAEEFMARGFDWGDVVRVNFLNTSLLMPVVPDFTYVDTGVLAVIIGRDESGEPAGGILLSINMGNFISTYGIGDKTTNEDKSWYWTAREGIEFPIRFLITMAEDGGYLEEYNLHDLKRTNKREDYKSLTDEEFANFRLVTTSGMHGKLYRGSSPISTFIGRNKEADAACKASGVTVALNLSDSQSDAEASPGFKGSYYSTTKIKYLSLGVDFSAADFKSGLAEGMKFLSENPGTYFIHCTEGKDRTGFVSALLECLMGATAKEVVEDYMVTYYNFYGVEKGTEKYETIAESNIVSSLKAAFGITDFYGANLAAEAEKYLLSLGLSAQEISNLKTNL